mgnify:CR=1 FL=1
MIEIIKEFKKSHFPYNYFLYLSDKSWQIVTLADKGDCSAMNNYALMLSNGQGVGKNL